MGPLTRGFGFAARDLCVEFIPPSQKQAGIAHKVREYFDGGAVQVWQVLLEAQKVVVLTAPMETRALNAHDLWTAESILPGFFCRVPGLFTME